MPAKHKKKPDMELELMRLLIGVCVTLFMTFGLVHSCHMGILPSFLAALSADALLMAVAFEFKAIAKGIFEAMAWLFKYVAYFIVCLGKCAVFILSVLIEISLLTFAWLASGFDSTNLLYRLDKAFAKLRKNLELPKNSIFIFAVMLLVFSVLLMVFGGSIGAIGAIAALIAALIIVFWLCWFAVYRYL